MANFETIEAELKQYVEDAQNLSRQDRYTHLRAIFDKHFAMEKTEHVLTMSDFNGIVSYAKTHYNEISLPATISNRDVYPSDVGQLCTIEALVSYLNKFKILKRLVRIDYTTKTNK